MGVPQFGTANYTDWDRELHELGPRITRIGTANYANRDRELRE